MLNESTGDQAPQRDQQDDSPRGASPAMPVTAQPGAATGPQPEVLRIEMRRLDPGMPLPRTAKPGDAGMDLRSREDVVLEPGRRQLIPTGIAVAVPPGWVGLVHPRSGLAAGHGITVLNTPGTIDSGYRGEIKITLLNTDRTEAFRIGRGDRIAQLLLQRVALVETVEVETLDETERGATGFGSSGTR